MGLFGRVDLYPTFQQYPLQHDFWAKQALVTMLGRAALRRTRTRNLDPLTSHPPIPVLVHTVSIIHSIVIPSDKGTGTVLST